MRSWPGRFGGPCFQGPKVLVTKWTNNVARRACAGCSGGAHRREDKLVEREEARGLKVEKDVKFEWSLFTMFFCR
jgi:hypothetical protein